MSDRKQTDSDRAMARLLADALRQPESEANKSACPDAQILAAYAEQNLDSAETARWENHFAECDRCQKILAVLTVSEEPLTDTELERFGRKVAEAELAASPAASREQGKREQNKKIAPFERPQTAWRWIAPALGIAAAAALWIALRPLPRPAPVAITAQNSQSETALPPGEGLQAQANVPPSPAARRDLEQRTPQSPEVSGALKKESAPAAKPQAPTGQSSAPQPSEAAPPSQNQAASESQPEPVLQASNEPAKDLAKTKQSESPAATAQAGAAAAPPAAPAPPPAASADALARAAAPPAPSANSVQQAQAAPAPTAAPEAKTAPNRTVQLFSARQRIAGLTGAAREALVTLSSPTGNVSWRIGSGGQIQRSLDHGQTWQPQASGIANDLLAGFALSDKVAWIVGRAGVILRTTDGEHWQRVASPNPAADWTAIQATSAQHVTITSADQRRFVTDDAGQTWNQQ